MESSIYPLPIYPNDPHVTFNRDFLDGTSNALTDLLPDTAAYADCVKVIDIPAAANGRTLEIVMNADQEEALEYLKADGQPLT